MSKNVTVVLIGNNKLNGEALKKTLSVVDCEEVITFTTDKLDPNAIHIPVAANFSKEDYNFFVMKNLWPFIKTSHVLIVQWDGMAVNREFWTDDFLEFDYVGSPWPGDDFWVRPEERVGNGGFSLRSKRLLEALRDPNIRTFPGSYRTESEDAVICQLFNRYLTDTHGIKFAPLEAAYQFGQEFCFERNGHTFGFHGVWNTPLYLSEDETLYYLQQVDPYYWSDQRAQLFWNNCVQRNYNKVVDFIRENLVK